MTIKPILFSPMMIQALLAGRKSQTRRVITKGIEDCGDGKFHCFNSGGGIVGVHENEISDVMIDYLPIQIGDKLYVREAWKAPKRMVHGLMVRFKRKSRLWLESEPLDRCIHI